MLLKSKQLPLEFVTKSKFYKKQHKVKHKSACFSTKATNTDILNFKSTKYLTVKQAVALLKIIKPKMKDFGRRTKAQLHLKFDTLLTRKPKDIRMGRGKGAPSERVHILRAGSKFIELVNVSKDSAVQLFNECLPKTATKAIHLNTNKW